MDRAQAEKEKRLKQAAKKTQAAIRALTALKRMLGDPDAGPGNTRKTYEQRAALDQVGAAALRVRELYEMLSKEE